MPDIEDLQDSDAFELEEPAFPRSEPTLPPRGTRVQFISSLLQKVDDGSQDTMLRLQLQVNPGTVTHLERIAVVIGDGSIAYWTIYVAESSAVPLDDPSNVRDGYGATSRGSFDFASPIRVVSDWAELGVRATGQTAGAKVTARVQGYSVPADVFDNVRGLLEVS